MFNKLNRRKARITEPQPGGAVVLSINNNSRGLEFLIELVNKIRPEGPGNIQQAELKFKALLYSLQQDRSLLFSLRRSLLTQFLNTDIVTALIESGITSSRGFVQELLSKLQHKVLPPLQHKNDFLFVINRVFYQKTDYRWVEGINPELWKSFFELLGIQINLEETAIIRQLQQSLQILSYRLANTGLEKEINMRFDQRHTANYPFMEQNRLINLFLERQQHNRDSEEKKILLNNINEALHNCRQSLTWMKDKRATEGTSLSQTFLFVRMEQHIERLFIIIDVLDGDQQFNTERFIQYFSKVIRFENRKNSLGEFLSENLALLAYQIAEHKGRKGEAYIAISKKDFRALFRFAMTGGVIISFIAIFKNLLGKLPLAPFWQGLVYGSNYAFGFVLMDQVGGTLATKQPAYTASSVASSLDSKKTAGQPDLQNLAITVSRVSRSQIASFAGNLIIVFPLTYALAWLWHLITGHKIAEGTAAMALLQAQHPWQSLALLYACFTGFFLFLSGIIAGYVENHVVYGKIPERLSTHPVLSFTMSKKRLSKLVNLIRRSSGALAGSISLGLFLGIAGPLGKIMGLPFDIRHITISAGNTAIGFYGLDHNVPVSYMIIIAFGVLHATAATTPRAGSCGPDAWAAVCLSREGVAISRAPDQAACERPIGLPARAGIPCLSGGDGARIAGNEVDRRRRDGGPRISAEELPARGVPFRNGRAAWRRVPLQRDATSLNFTTFVSHSFGQPPAAPTMRPRVPPWSWPRVLSQFGWAGPGSLCAIRMLTEPSFSYRAVNLLTEMSKKRWSRDSIQKFESWRFQVWHSGMNGMRTRRASSGAICQWLW